MEPVVALLNFGEDLEIHHHLKQQEVLIFQITDM
jgi:hypothetical protein